MSHLDSDTLQLINELQFREHALNDIESFRAYMARSYHNDFIEKPAKHHQVLQEALMRLMYDDDLDGLMIEMPPGSAKSVYSSVQFACMWLAKYPDSGIIAISNTTSLAEGFSRRRREACLTKEWSQLAQAYLPKDHQSLGEFGTNKQGFMIAAGMGSSVSGRRCRLLIIDDPITGVEQAMAMGQLEKQWNSYKFEYRNRIIPGGKQLIISTRWSQFDIIGMITKEIEKGEEQRRWEKLTIPMEAVSVDDPVGRKPGERLWPEWFTQTMVEENKKDPLLWSALYQQVPIDSAGSWVPKEHIHIAEKVPENVTLLTAMDLALTVSGGDYTVIVTAALSDERKLYIIDVSREQVAQPETMKRLAMTNEAHRPSVVLIDDDNASKVFVEAAHDYVRLHKTSNIPLYKMKTAGKDKELRAAAIRGMFLSDRVYMLDRPWVAEVMKEISSFPPKSRNDHDDIIDCLSLLGRYLGKSSTPRVIHKPKVKPLVGALTVTDGIIHTTQTLDQLAKKHTSGKVINKYRI